MRGKFPQSPVFPPRRTCRLRGDAMAGSTVPEEGEPELIVDRGLQCGPARSWKRSCGDLLDTNARVLRRAGSPGSSGRNLVERKVTGGSGGNHALHCFDRDDPRPHAREPLHAQEAFQFAEPVGIEREQQKDGRKRTARPLSGLQLRQVSRRKAEQAFEIPLRNGVLEAVESPLGSLVQGLCIGLLEGGIESLRGLLVEPFLATPRTDRKFDGGNPNVLDVPVGLGARLARPKLDRAASRWTLVRLHGVS